MPWKECVALDQRIEFVILARARSMVYRTPTRSAMSRSSCSSVRLSRAVYSPPAPSA
jgi:hypothetical protein